MHEVVMPKLGNTVESVIIVEWRKDVGEQVNTKEVLCEVETDKATVEVEAEAAGILLAKLFDVGDEVPVLSRFAVLGEEGEDVSTLLASDAPGADNNVAASAKRQSDGMAPISSSEIGALPEASYQPDEGDHLGISPRARNLALSAGLSPRLFVVPAAVGSTPEATPIPSPGAISISGTGPGGRIIERDVERVLARLPRSDVDSEEARGNITSDTPIPSAQATLAKPVPPHDAVADSTELPTSEEETRACAGSAQGEFSEAIEVIPVRGLRKIIASRMHASLSETAQLTLNSSAPANSILTWRQSFKEAPIEQQDVSINHLLMFTVARLLPHHLELNATFHGSEIHRYANVHLGFAVDTRRGLITPVIRNANRKSLNSLTTEARKLADACKKGNIPPDELVGSTFTVTNLGALGIESFTPVLNAPEVAILGIGAITNAPIETETGIAIEKRIGLSLTINHQAVDGAPGARFLAHLVRVLSKLELVTVL